MIKKQRDKSQIYKIRNGKGEMARVSWTKFKNIIRLFCKTLSNTFENGDEVDNFLGR